MADCSCNTITAIENSCDADFVGGIKRMFVVEKCAIESLGYESPSGIIDVITMVSPETFLPMYFKKNTSTYTENINTNGAITQTLTLVVNVINSDALNGVQSLFRKDLVALVQDNNDMWRMFGEKNGLEATSGDVVPGTNSASDIPTITVTMIGTERSFAKEVLEATAESVI